MIPGTDSRGKIRKSIEDKSDKIGKLGFCVNNKCKKKGTKNTKFRIDDDRRDFSDFSSLEVTRQQPEVGRLPVRRRFESVDL